MPYTSLSRHLHYYGRRTASFRCRARHLQLLLLDAARFLCCAQARARGLLDAARLLLHSADFRRRFLLRASNLLLRARPCCSNLGQPPSFHLSSSLRGSLRDFRRCLLLRLANFFFHPCLRFGLLRLLSFLLSTRHRCQSRFSKSCVPQQSAAVGSGGQRWAAVGSGGQRWALLAPAAVRGLRVREHQPQVRVLRPRPTVR